MPLIDAESSFSATTRRVSNLGYEDPVIVALSEQRFNVLSILETVGYLGVYF
tara:strand:+ start:733 stop:888 length:156 start_codon:yes stop_codon:yes gene_type:complete